MFSELNSKIVGKACLNIALLVLVCSFCCNCDDEPANSASSTKDVPPHLSAAPIEAFRKSLETQLKAAQTGNSGDQQRLSSLGNHPTQYDVAFAHLSASPTYSTDSSARMARYFPDPWHGSGVNNGTDHYRATNSLYSGILDVTPASVNVLSSVSNGALLLVYKDWDANLPRYFGALNNTVLLPKTALLPRSVIDEAQWAREAAAFASLSIHEEHGWAPTATGNGVTIHADSELSDNAGEDPAGDNGDPVTVGGTSAAANADGAPQIYLRCDDDGTNCIPVTGPPPQHATREQSSSGRGAKETLPRSRHRPKFSKVRRPLRLALNIARFPGIFPQARQHATPALYFIQDASPPRRYNGAVTSLHLARFAFAYSHRSLYINSYRALNALLNREETVIIMMLHRRVPAGRVAPTEFVTPLYREQHLAALEALMLNRTLRHQLLAPTGAVGIMDEEALPIDEVVPQAWHVEGGGRCAASPSLQKCTRLETQQWLTADTRHPEVQALAPLGDASVLVFSKMLPGSRDVAPSVQLQQLHFKVPRCGVVDGIKPEQNGALLRWLDEASDAVAAFVHGRPKPVIATVTSATLAQVMVEGYRPSGVPQLDESLAARFDAQQVRLSSHFSQHSRSAQLRALQPRFAALLQQVLRGSAAPDSQSLDESFSDSWVLVPVRRLQKNAHVLERVGGGAAPESRCALWARVAALKARRRNVASVALDGTIVRGERLRYALLDLDTDFALFEVFVANAMRGTRWTNVTAAATELAELVSASHRNARDQSGCFAIAVAPRPADSVLIHTASKTSQEAAAHPLAISVDTFPTSYADLARIFALLSSTAHGQATILSAVLASIVPDAPRCRHLPAITAPSADRVAGAIEELGVLQRTQRGGVFARIASLGSRSGAQGGSAPSPTVSLMAGATLWVLHPQPFVGVDVAPYDAASAAAGNAPDESDSAAVVNIITELPVPCVTEEGQVEVLLLIHDSRQCALGRRAEAAHREVATVVAPEFPHLFVVACDLGAPERTCELPNLLVALHSFGAPLAVFLNKTHVVISRSFDLSFEGLVAFVASYTTAPVPPRHPFFEEVEVRDEADAAAERKPSAAAPAATNAVKRATGAARVLLAEAARLRHAAATFRDIADERKVGLRHRCRASIQTRAGGTAGVRRRRLRRL